MPSFPTLIKDYPLLCVAAGIAADVTFNIGITAGVVSAVGAGSIYTGVISLITAVKTGMAVVGVSVYIGSVGLLARDCAPPICVISAGMAAAMWSAPTSIITHITVGTGTSVLLLLQLLKTSSILKHHQYDTWSPSEWYTVYTTLPAIAVTAGTIFGGIPGMITGAQMGLCCFVAGAAVSLLHYMSILLQVLTGLARIGVDLHKWSAPAS